jgi:hypothetical protein
MAKTINYRKCFAHILPSLVGMVAACSLWSSLSLAATQQPIKTLPDEILAKLYLGEIYPSGHIYVQSVQSPSDNTAWPQELNVQGMRGSIVAGGLAKAKFFKPVSNEYPPGAEGMEKEDYNHNKSCGWKYSIQPKFQYSEPDYFETVFDYCERDSKLGLYKTTLAISEAHNIVAGSGTLILDKPDYSQLGKPRPMTRVEKKIVQEERAKATASSDACDTNQSFLDSAEQLSTFPVLNTHYSIRISHYSNPGCGGHLVEIYIVDLLEDNRLKNSVLVSRYFGPI